MVSEAGSVTRHKCQRDFIKLHYGLAKELAGRPVQWIGYRCRWALEDRCEDVELLGRWD
jgi:hypothetical protein